MILIPRKFREFIKAEGIEIKDEEDRRLWLKCWNSGFEAGLDLAADMLRNPANYHATTDVGRLYEDESTEL